MLPSVPLVSHLPITASLALLDTFYSSATLPVCQHAPPLLTFLVLPVPPASTPALLAVLRSPVYPV